MRPNYVTFSGGTKKKLLLVINRALLAQSLPKPQNVDYQQGTGTGRTNTPIHDVLPARQLPPHPGEVQCEQIGGIVHVSNILRDKGIIPTKQRQTAGHEMPSRSICSHAVATITPPILLRTLHLRRSPLVVVHLPSAGHIPLEARKLLSNFETWASFGGVFSVSMER